MNISRNSLPILILIITFAACNREGYENDQYGDLSINEAEVILDEASPLTSNLNSNGGNSATEKSERNAQEIKIIKNAEIRAEVDDAAKAANVLTQQVIEAGGYVANSEVKQLYNRIEATLQLRVPASAFESTVEQSMQTGGKVTFKRIWSSDVTEEYIDIETRLKNKKEVEARYIDILRSKAKTVEDVLATEEKLRVIREEIEVQEGRLRYLKNRVAMSTIQVQYTQYVASAEAENETPGFMSKMKDALGNGWHLVLQIILFFTNIWPLLLVAVAVYYLMKRFRKKAKN